MKIKVSELKDAKLAEWVAKAQGWEIKEYCDPLLGCEMVWAKIGVDSVPIESYRPDLKWSQCGELVVEFELTLDRNDNGDVIACAPRGFAQIGIKGDELVLFCRAVVASVYGEEVGE